jgi:hypothetical protein
MSAKRQKALRKSRGDPVWAEIERSGKKMKEINQRLLDHGIDPYKVDRIMLKYITLYCDGHEDEGDRIIAESLEGKDVLL